MSFQIKSASFYKSVFEIKNLPENNFPQIAFAGRSNVGKSSLLNALVEQKNLAKTSSTPGKTQMLNFFLINNNLFFVDLPGYGYAQAPKKTITRWGKLIEDYIKNSENLKGLIQIIDIRHPPFPSDLELLEWLNFLGKKVLIVLTKKDKLSKSAVLSNLKNAKDILKLNEELLVPFSAKTKEGGNKILEWIGSLLKEELIKAG
jgi:GTP-binding protein